MVELEPHGTMSEAELLEARIENLVLQATAGDVKAFSSLVQLHQERSIRLAYSFLGEWEDARDVAQNAFVKAYRNIRSFEGRSEFSTWVHRIVINECKDFLRKKKVRKHLSVFSKKSTEETTQRAEDQVPTSENALNTMLQGELGDQIRNACEKLPAQQRIVFILRYLDDMSLKEIAVTLELSLGAVKSNLWQAAKKMREELSHYLKVGDENA